MDGFPPFNVIGSEGGRMERLPQLTIAFDLAAAYDVAEVNYTSRDCPMMWPFACVHTLYICGPRAKDAFRRYISQMRHSPFSMGEFGAMWWNDVPITFTNAGEGFMFVEREPSPYTRKRYG